MVSTVCFDQHSRIESNLCFFIDSAWPQPKLPIKTNSYQKLIKKNQSSIVGDIKRAKGDTTGTEIEYSTWVLVFMMNIKLPFCVFKTTKMEMACYVFSDVSRAENIFTFLISKCSNSGLRPAVLIALELMRHDLYRSCYP